MCGPPHPPVEFLRCPAAIRPYTEERPGSFTPRWTSQGAVPLLDHYVAREGLETPACYLYLPGYVVGETGEMGEPWGGGP